MTFIEAVELNLTFQDDLRGDVVIGEYAESTVYPEDNVSDLDDYEVGDIVTIGDYDLQIKSIDEDGYVDLIEFE